MSSPDPTRQYPFGGFAGPYQLPPAQYPDNPHPQGYPYNYQALGQRPPSVVNYIQPHYGTTAPVPPIAELPAPLPPAPPTSTSQQQLTEDELLAHKLQQMEVEEVRRRSSSNLSHRPSQSVLGSPPSPQIPQGHLQQPGSTTRPHIRSVSSLAPWGPNSFGPPPSQPTPSLLPEVVAGPRPVSTAVPRASVPVLHPTTHLPPPPVDPASLAAYLDQHRQVPCPPQWVLHPPIMTFFGSFVHAPKTDWLDIPVSREWRTVRLSENASNPTLPSFSFSFKIKGGSFRDPQYTWTMAPAATKGKLRKAYPSNWSYQLKMNPASGLRKSELLFTPQMKQLLTTYIHARNYDSLRFVGPDGRLYLWVTHAPLSSTNGARFDTLRHALFASTHGRHDPLYGEIVADHTYWDGFVDHNEVHSGISCNGCGAVPINGLRWKCKSCVDHDICEPCRLAKTSLLPTCTFTLVNLPDEALNIRSPTVDPALVVATLQILKDWELQTIREQKRADPRGFEATESAARKTDFGRISHWRSTDFAQKGAPADVEVHGTVVKMRELSRTVAEVANVLSTIGDAVNAGSIGDGVGSAAGDSGGGSGGGGDGGSGGGGVAS
ncbi:hypothetical protein K458DRAFT_159499 [Lentithecium fluviatile CBS 122367]|uniref:ZZ-type domain-containing protein n=1 Tax=Lentithecium fluviatile CBS 122367 TaxID=1168545 RepID=A0A6G1IHJ0_9PLEO|nr:hypothetical protein K458DRAFT_159499 [Lentithecium fluviatile CBS 122367]